VSSLSGHLLGSSEATLMAIKFNNGGLSQWSGMGCLVFFALFWSTMTLGFDAHLVRNAFRQIRALGYATAAGSVTHSEVETIDGDEGFTDRAKIQYKYSAAGKEYVGYRYRYGQWSSGGQVAHRIVAAHPVGAQVEVYYAPSDPTDSVLTAGLEGMDLFFAMFMLPFNLVMLGFWIAIVGIARQRLFAPPAGGARTWDDGRYVRVRLSLWNPLFSAAAAGGLAFSATFVIAFGFSADPSLATMLVAWAVILGGGAAVWLYGCWKQAGGGSDLILDKFRQCMTLPPSQGREEELVLPFDKVVSIEVATLEKPGSEGGVSRSYLPTVVFTDSDGSERRERIAKWPPEDRAQGLAAWLRERLVCAKGSGLRF
jgi:hypothetical protein